MFKKLFANRVEKLADPTVSEALKHAASSDIISLAGGIPNPKLFPKQEVVEIINDIVENNLDSVLQYSITAGIPKLREEIAKYYTNKWSKKIKPENILITSGSQQGIDLIGKTFLNDSKDLVIVENPTYLVAITAFNTYNPSYISIDSTNGQPNLKKIETALEKNKNIKFIYAIPTFQNPTGSTWSVETRQEVLKLVKKHNVLLIEDEPYSEIYFDKAPPHAIYSMDTNSIKNNNIDSETDNKTDNKNTVYLGTFSKTLMPGLRIGFVIADKELIKTFTLIKQSMDLHSPVFSQLLTAKLLEKPKFYQNHIKKLRKYYQENANYLLDLLKENLSEHASWNIPNGGLFIWVTSKNISSKILFKKALEKKIAFMPGYPFYADNTENEDQYTFRLTFSTATKKEMKEAVEKLRLCFEG